ncbi:Inner centromere protein, ARK-binding domain containing protein [Parasponia andersonii]|uniref:Inner centromere protein, ARK-binding domain containing protein n=1 Tax=Parasponia andersonii TaxID=3476 RepID=A0A2P5B3S2_PARAD|nr:Inner centromere protein, ARK-binding domain containing protein [Parasponia andersonii]
MSTIEKLFVQIFERKSYIIDQVKQQTHLFDQHLASKLLIDGIAPPPWFWNSARDSRTSDPSESNAEDLISGVLLSCPRPVVPFSFSHCSVYEKPVAEATNGELSNGLCEEVCVESRGFDGLDHAGCVSVGVSTLDHCNTLVADHRGEAEDTSITSPQDQRDTRTSDVNHEPALSLAKIQRSRSRQRALELRNSAKISKSQLKNDNNCSSYSGGSIAVPSFKDDQPEELNLVKPVDSSNNDCAVEDVKIVDSWSKEKESTVYSTKSSGRQQSSLNGGSSFNVVREHGSTLAGFVAPSVQLSNPGNQPLESPNHFQIGYNNHMVTEAKVGDNRSKEKGISIECRMVTRSRSSGQQTNCVSELFKLDGPSDSQKKNGSCSPTSQAQIANRNEIVKSADITEESRGVKAQVDESRSNKQATDGFSGRITRSKSSTQPSNTDYDLSKPLMFSSTQENLDVSEVNSKENLTMGNSIKGYVPSSTRPQAACMIQRIPEALDCNISAEIITESIISTSNRSQNGVGTQKSAERSSFIREDQEQCAANSTDSSDEENAVDDCVGKNTRTSITEGTSKLVNSQDLGCRVTRSRSAALNKHPDTKSVDSSEGVGPNNVSGVDVKDLPYTSTSQAANLEECATTAKDIDTDVSVEVHPVCSGSNLEGAGLVELEVLAPCPADCSMVVEPKQLNFDDVETSSVNGFSALSVRNDAKERLLKRSPLALSGSAGILAKGMSENYQEIVNFPVEEREGLSKEEEPQKVSSDACTEDRDTALVALNGHAVSVEKETPHVGKDIATDNLQQSGKNSKEKTSSRDHLLTVARESLPGSLLKEVSSSNITNANADKGMNLSFETETRTPMTAIPAELVSLNSRQEIISPVDGKLSKDADFPLVTKPGLFEIQEACADSVGELPCSVSKDETEGDPTQSTVNLGISQLCTAESSERSIHDVTHVGLSQSTQRQTIARPTAKTGSSASIEGSATQNKRKRSDSLDNLSTSPDPKENAVLPFNKDSEFRDLLSEEHSLKDVLESQDLQIPEDDVLQLVIGRSKVEGKYQSEEDNMQEGSESAFKFQVQVDDFSLKDTDRCENTLVAFMDEELEASLVSSVVRQAAGDCKGHLMEKTRMENPTNIIFDGVSRCTLVENEFSSHLEDKFGIQNAEALTYSEPLYSTGADETMPVLEGFIMQSDDEQPSIADEGISFDKLNLPNTSVERAGLLEQLCRSACLPTPASRSSTPYKLHKISNLYQSVPTGLLEGMDMKNKLPINDFIKLKGYDCLSEDFNCAFKGRSYSDCLPNSTIQSDWDIKKPCISPVRKVWDRIISKSGSEKRRSLNPELPCISEENESIDEVADAYGEGIVSEIVTNSAKREPLVEIIANLSASEAEPYVDRCSLDSVNTEFSFNGTHNRVKKNLGNGKCNKRRFNNKENDTLSLGPAALKGKTASLHNTFSKPKLSSRTSSRRGGPSITETEPKPSNIVSNVTSFIPLVQQKQAAAVVTGKRDIKVKALEAAEAAKRLTEKKENERKAKKEAMKLERARVEQENLRQLELQKKTKEEERKKKEADMAAKKRQREEEERKEKERKRLRIEETRKLQKENEQKLHALKKEKELKCQTMDDKGYETNESKNERRNHKKMEQRKGDENFQTISEAEPATTQASSSDDRETSIIHEDIGVSSDFAKNLKVNNLEKPTGAEHLVATTSQEQSYDISPYKCSDDEDEDDDEVPNTKFVPSWARKTSVALAVSSQDRVDPEAIFLPESFCSIAEVLLPRKYQLKIGGT